MECTSYVVYLIRSRGVYKTSCILTDCLQNTMSPSLLAGRTVTLDSSHDEKICMWSFLIRAFLCVCFFTFCVCVWESQYISRFDALRASLQFYSHVETMVEPQRIKYLAQLHSTIPSVCLELATPRV